MARQHWLFGYGSLIWRVDFPYHERRPARIRGFKRRFWQGSHDHRGTPESPGRVVTLVADPAAACVGVAYRIDADAFPHLDHREKNGYERVETELEFADGAGGAAPGVVYIASAANKAYLGAASLDEIARHIEGAAGPSGRNSDYLLELASALAELGVEDEHVSALAARLAEPGVGA